MINDDMDLTNDTAMNAARNGNLEMVKYLYKYGCPFSTLGITRIAAENGFLDILKFAIENVCLYNDTHIIEIIKCGSLECLQYLVSLGESLKVEYYLRYAFYCGKLEIFKYIVDHAFCSSEDDLSNFNELFSRIFTTNFSRSRMECLKYIYLKCDNKQMFWNSNLDHWSNGFDLNDPVWREAFNMNLECCKKLETRILKKKEYIRHVKKELNRIFENYNSIRDVIVNYIYKYI
jgi:hypothetical protein